VGPTRPLQLGLIEGTDRYTGGTLDSVIHGTNADLIERVAPWYLTGTVLDVTYGGGRGGAAGAHKSW